MWCVSLPAAVFTNWKSYSSPWFAVLLGRDVHWTLSTRPRRTHHGNSFNDTAASRTTRLSPVLPPHEPFQCGVGLVCEFVDESRPSSQNGVRFDVAPPLIGGIRVWRRDIEVRMTTL